MEVKINGVEVELGNSSPAITKRSIDINNITARFIDITNRFVLPDVLINRKALNSPQNIANTGRGFEKQYDVTIHDNVQLFRGKGFVSETTDNSIAVQCVSPENDVLKLFDKRLKELYSPIGEGEWGYDNMDTVLSTSEIDDLDTYDADNVWFWGKACYHEIAVKANTDQTTGDDRCKYSRPAFNIHSLLKLICAEAGYSFTPPALQLAISSNHSDFFFTSYQITLVGDNIVSGSANLYGLNFSDFEKDVTTTDSTIDIGDNKTVFRVRGSITSTADMTLIIKATDNIDSNKIVQSEMPIIAGTQDYDFSTAEMQSDDDMTVEVILSGTGTVTFNDTLLYTIISEKTKDLSSNPFLGYKIKAYDNLPDITFIDLFKTLCLCGNYLQNVDTFNKSFGFISMASLNKLLADDWSDKFIQGSEKISNNTQGLAKTNYLRYKNDRTVRTGLGESFFEIDNDNLPDVGTYIELPFGASNDVVINSNTVAQVPCYNDTSRITEPEPIMRLFMIDGSTLQFAPIAWESLKDNYTELFNSMYRSRVIHCEMNLSKLDFLKWTPRRLCYIDYFKTTFQILEIENFIPGELTTVKLLKYGR